MAGCKKNKRGGHRFDNGGEQFKTAAFGFPASLVAGYASAPKRESVDPYLHNAAVLGNYNYQPNTMSGLMDQYAGAPKLSIVDRLHASTPQLVSTFTNAGINSQNVVGGFNSYLNSLRDTETTDDTDDAETTTTGTKACGGHLKDLGGILGATGQYAAGAAGSLAAVAGYGSELAQNKSDILRNYAANNFAYNRGMLGFDRALQDTKNNMARTQLLNTYSMGGDMVTNGGIFNLGGNYNEINSGGSHEENIFNGVQQGFAPDGQPNKVEEGEVVWNDYVFSNSRRNKKNRPDLKLTDELLEKYKFLNEKMTYADAAKKLSEETKERPNDPISKRGMDVFMNDLMNAQEQVRMEMAMKDLKRQINKMSPEDLMALQMMMQQGAQQQGIPQMPQDQMEMQQQVPQEQMPMDDSSQPMEETLAALGGDLFSDGGHLFKMAGHMSHKRAVPSKQKSDRPTQTVDVTTDSKYDGTNASSILAQRYLSQFAGNDQMKKLMALATMLGIDPTTIANTGTVDDTRLLTEALQGYTQDQLHDAFTKSVNSVRYKDGETPFTRILGDNNTNVFQGFLDYMPSYTASLIPGNMAGYYRPDNSQDAKKIENEQAYQTFNSALWKIATTADDQKPDLQGDETNYKDVTKAQALQYLHNLDKLNHTKGSDNAIGGPEDLFVSADSNEFRGGIEEAKKQYDKLKYDQKGGIYHIYKTLTEHPDLEERTIYVDRNGKEIDYNPETMSPFWGAPVRLNDVISSDGRQITHRFQLDPTQDTDYQLPEDTPRDKYTPLPTWPRYMGAMGSIGAAINSMFERPKDYGTYVAPRIASYEPIGDYLTPQRIDSQRYLNAANGLAAAQAQGILNGTSGNRNMALAQSAFNNAQRQQSFNDALASIEGINFGRTQQVGDFNRGTNQFNATGFNGASQTNFGLNNFLLGQAQQNAAMRHTVDNELDAARGANISNALDNISGIGSENLAFNMANSNPALYFGMGKDGILNYLNRGNQAKNGGLLTKRNRRK